MSDDCPRLRGVEAFPIQHEGRDFVALRDPSGFTPAVLLLPVEVLEIVGHFDGAHSIVDIQADVMRRRGELVLREKIEHIVAMLDEQGFLDSPRFAERRAGIEREFLAAPFRPATHAGGAYPAEPDALRATMDRFFDPPAGPGAIAAGDDGAVPPPPVTGVIAPHIDFHRGGPAYAWAYRDVAERCDADLFVIFGTCHTGLTEPFAATGKDYDTPFGPAPVDREMLDRLASRSPVDLFASEVSHRQEHSIEFQAVFLRYLFAGHRDFTILPVLTSFAHEAMMTGERPEDDPRVLGFFDALVDVVQASGRRVALVAGADLAHVGPRFGDPAPLTRRDMARVEREDAEMLRAVEDGDPQAFFTSVAADRDRRRICGLSPIWSLLHVLRRVPAPLGRVLAPLGRVPAPLDGRRGTLRHYGHTNDPECLVSFASVVFP